MGTDIVPRFSRHFHHIVDHHANRGQKSAGIEKGLTRRQRCLEENVAWWHGNSADFPSDPTCPDMKDHCADFRLSPYKHSMPAPRVGHDVTFRSCVNELSSVDALGISHCKTIFRVRANFDLTQRPSMTSRPPSMAKVPILGKMWQRPWLKVQ